MRVLAGLFGKSPFFPLQEHMEHVVKCVNKLPDIFDALKAQNFDKIELLAKEVSRLEHLADLAKNDLRNHLPKSLWLPVDREMLLNMLSLQDDVADTAEDIAILFTLKKLHIKEELLNDFEQLLKTNIICFEKAHSIVTHLHELFQSSFGGLEAESVCIMVEDVAAFQEHQVDVEQSKLLKKLFNLEGELSYSSFHLLVKILESAVKISDLSKKLANCIRLTIERR